MRIVLVAGFLEMVLQFFLCVAAALTHRPHLLRCRRRMRVLVRAMVLDAANFIFAHTEIVPLYASAGKRVSRLKDDGAWSVVCFSRQSR
ncbi:hypothetical protein GCM10009712_45330 [Pseudarthrobacter sulfonivorans]